MLIFENCLRLVIDFVGRREVIYISCLVSHSFLRILRDIEDSYDSYIQMKVYNIYMLHPTTLSNCYTIIQHCRDDTIGNEMALPPICHYMQQKQNKNGTRTTYKEYNNNKVLLKDYFIFQISHKSLKGKIMIGVAAARFHSAIFTKNELFTFGLNAGQLGMYFCKN